MEKAGPTGGPGLKAFVITVSDRCSRGQAEDLSGPELAAMLADAGFEVVGKAIVPDERPDISKAVIKAARAADLVVTTGGTGIAPRDRTPEATRDVIDLEIPGIAELMRIESLKKTPNAALSRAVAGLLGGSLVVNLPGSVKGARENLLAVLPVVRHAVELARGSVRDCGR